MTYEHRSVLTIGRTPSATNAGYENWFPELRKRQPTKAAKARAATTAYPTRWLPDVAARTAARLARPRVAR